MGHILKPNGSHIVLKHQSKCARGREGETDYWGNGEEIKCTILSHQQHCEHRSCVKTPDRAVAGYVYQAQISRVVDIGWSIYTYIILDSCIFNQGKGVYEF